MNSPFPARGHRLPARELSPLTQIGIERYLEAAGDDNPLHRDPELARRAGLAGIPVPGMLLMGLVADRVRNWEWCGRIIKLTARFTSPLIVGTGATIEARVVAIDETAGRATLRVTMASAGQIAVMAEALVALRAP